ncbi:prolipoprotein diacylglyceryl transferase [Patescibacteria group bacterium]|nr:prolipoprotein diacylglyceryl transferase [Patescibacteria group bacterium]
MFAIILNPTITIQISPLTIYTWGLLVSIGIILGLILAWYLAKKEKLNFDHVLNISLISIILGFIGSRLLFIFLEPQQFQNPIEIIRIWDGGLASYGGLILAIFGSIIYAKKNKLDAMKYADMFVLPIALAFAVARIGCTLVNDHLGKLTDIPWGITVDGITRHPISAYYSIGLFLLVAILLLFRKNLLNIKGGSTFFALTFYSLLNFIIDNFKDFEDKTFNYYANQIFLLLVFVVSFYFLYKKIMWYNKNSEIQNTKSQILNNIK